MQWNPLYMESVRSLRDGPSVCQFLPETLTSLRVGTFVSGCSVAGTEQMLRGFSAGTGVCDGIRTVQLRSRAQSLRRRHGGWCRIGNGMIRRVDRAAGREDRDAGGSQTGHAENLVAPQVLPDRPWLPLRPPLAPLPPADAPAGSQRCRGTLSRAPGVRVAPSGAWVPLCLQTLPELLFLFLSVALLHTRLTSVGAQ